MEIVKAILAPGASEWEPILPTGLDSARTLVLVFGSTTCLDDPAPLERLLRAFPRSTVVGCSTAGEISQQKLYDEHIVATIVRFRTTRVTFATAAVEHPDDSCAAGAALARELVAPDLRGIFVLSEGIAVNGSALVRGLNSVVPGGVSVTGGLAADGQRFQRTWVMANGKPRRRFAVAVGLHGVHLRIGTGSRGGWDAFGLERIVTRSRGSELLELDGKPALQLYLDYLGELASGLPATALRFPLSLRASTKDDRRLVRTVLAVDHDRRSVTFAGDVPEGWRAQLMRANFDRLVDGAASAAASARLEGVRGPSLAIAVSCMGRRLALGGRVEEELEATLDILGQDAHQVGLYSNGEIAPYISGPSHLHNQTMTITHIAEDQPCSTDSSSAS